ncbi:PAS domain-containing methyl-accepting chemotaxis protein [Bradyrhizobium sp. CCGUVB4N]|uniref:methyl-accepting chemotaxis protein n=1 Tax=Bradyrhizobium sp. CCGUVB4N TaxID=2949631 RepID=UPI0020B3E51A|nr:PAS domain-containing methyl-accepting chemotaxis protein [Bradyrhizobium sp. CCGUVB4N]MCP3380755.1 PAS domain-containing methyl-accepting chemotaxis protein [Bradyrhizobium sp. CCGUVB4N]
MFGLRKSRLENSLAETEAIARSQAVIEFRLDGTIVKANQNFLDALGYGALSEIEGKHHRIFMQQSDAERADYKDFWARLNRSEYQTGEFKRIRKDGRPVWIQASYNPVLDGRGQATRVIKFATDITARKMKALEDAGKLAAIDRVQAVIEFELDGTIITANGTFLDAMGYTLPEVTGRHHSMFVEPAVRESAGYADAWAKLRRGEFVSGEYKRLGKNGREVWILASYNPILDEAGRPFKVVKFASDVTEKKLLAADSRGQIDAIMKSQAVIEFEMDGTIRWANDAFLKAMGYSLADVVGKHHRIFVESAEHAARAYTEFWDNLRRGTYQAGEFKRLAKGGREIWIEASYNPILDLNGKPFKVVKYATDVTAKAVARMKAEEARELIESVAAGSEEMSASIREISETMVKSREVVLAAVGHVGTADAQADRLTTAADQMGGIIELINSITGQINLLALNATIESARAGEAGRGFAVVASEVKSLANQAKHATDRITGEIDALKSVSRDVVGALDAIRGAIRHVNEYVTSTAAAVDEQSTVTSDMSTNMQRAAAALA